MSHHQLNGLKALQESTRGWAFSQTFYRDSLFKKIGYKTIEDLFIDWENDHVDNWDANNLLAKLTTWQKSDIVWVLFITVILRWH
jgi:homoserine O-acetyltransferase